MPRHSGGTMDAVAVSVGGSEAFVDVGQVQKNLCAAIDRNKQLHKAARKSRLLVKELIHKFAQTSCLDICQKVLFCLPKELRDMVYQEIFVPWDNSVVTISNESCNCNWVESGSLTMCAFAPQVLVPQNLYMYHTRDRGFCVPCPKHCFEAEFVGKQFLEELVEEWYSAIILDFSDAYGVLKTFMESENLTMGLQPASLLKRINIKVKAWDLIAKRHCNDDGACVGGHSQCKRASSFLASMKLLGNVNHKVHIQVELSPILEADKRDVLGTGHARAAQYGELVDVLQILKDSGHDVELRTTAWPAELPTLRNFMPFPERWCEWVEACRIAEHQILGNGGYSDSSYSGNSDFDYYSDNDYSEDSDYEENGSLCYESSGGKRSESHGSGSKLGESHSSSSKRSESHGSSSEGYGSDIGLDDYDVLIADQ